MKVRNDDSKANGPDKRSNSIAIGQALFILKLRGERRFENKRSQSTVSGTQREATSNGKLLRQAQDRISSCRPRGGLFFKRGGSKLLRHTLNLCTHGSKKAKHDSNLE